MLQVLGVTESVLPRRENIKLWTRQGKWSMDWNWTFKRRSSVYWCLHMVPGNVTSSLSPGLIYQCTLEKTQEVWSLEFRDPSEHHFLDTLYIVFIVVPKNHTIKTPGKKGYLTSPQQCLSEISVWGAVGGVLTNLPLLLPTLTDVCLLWFGKVTLLIALLLLLQ